MTDSKESLAHRPLAIYNMWPRNYTNNGQLNAFAEMAKDLSRVKAMGFNTVYVNPFYRVGHFPKSDGMIGSLYASKNMAETNASLFGGKTEPFFEGGKLTKSGQMVQSFCAGTRNLGLTPMFDLVQSHLSPDGDSPYVLEAKAQGIEILKKHPETGKYDIHGLDEHHIPSTDDPQHIWDDVVKFNFDDPRAKQFITTRILIPYVEQMADLGFRGVRIDSTPQTPDDVHQAVVGAFKERLRQIDRANYVDPPVLAETLNNEVSHDAKEVNGVASHCYSSGYFFPNAEEANAANLLGTSTQGQGRHWLKAEMWDKQQGMNGGTIIPVSTHDVPRLRAQLSKMFEKELAECASDIEKSEKLARWARIKIAFSAFMSSGGYMMTSGDEVLLNNRPSVFEGKVLSDAHPKAEIYLTAEERQKLIDDHNRTGLAELKQRMGVKPGYEHPFWKASKTDLPKNVLINSEHQSFVPHYVKERTTTNDPRDKALDLTGFIADINAGLAQRKEVSPHFYGDVYFTDKDPDVIGFISYTGDNHSLNEVVLVDVARNRTIAISEDRKTELLKDFAAQSQAKTGRAPSLQEMQDNLITVGNFHGKGKSWVQGF